MERQAAAPLGTIGIAGGTSKRTKAGQKTAAEHAQKFLDGNKDWNKKFDLCTADSRSSLHK
jgi:hypothetical protein